MCDEILRRMESMASPGAVDAIERYGIRSDKMLGLSMGQLSQLAKEIGRDHRMADCLWKAGSHDSRMLAAMIEEPAKVTEVQMESWVVEFDNWAICDGVCNRLFRLMPQARSKCEEWSTREEEFVKRAAFALMCSLAVHDRTYEGVFEHFLEICERESEDSRKYVMKAVNWAIRSIGKRDLDLNRKAIECAERIANRDSKTSRWIASDALRELRSEKVQERLLRHQKR